MARSRVLESQAVSIEQALARQQVKGMVLRGVVTPQHVRYEVMMESVAPEKEGGWSLKGGVGALADEISQALGKRDVRLRQNGSVLQVETVLEDVQPVRLIRLCEQIHHVPPVTVVLGTEENGAPLLLRLPATEVGHVLIAGITGAGKTALARTMIASLAMHNRQSQVQVVLIDPKGRGFAPMQHLPHVLGDLVRTPEETLDCLQWLVKEMDRRIHAHEAEPALVIAVDEVADLLQVQGGKVGALLTRLAQNGVAAGIHLILCAQKPTAEYIGSELKAAIQVRLVGAVANREEARYATGINESGAERLEGRGDFVLVCKEEVVHFQAAWVGRHDLERIEERLAQGGTLPLRFAPEALKQVSLSQAKLEQRQHRGPVARGMHFLWQRISGQTTTS